MSYCTELQVEENGMVTSLNMRERCETLKRAHPRKAFKDFARECDCLARKKKHYELQTKDPYV